MVAGIFCGDGGGGAAPRWYSLGKGEVVSSILTGSTIFLKQNQWLALKMAFHVCAYLRSFAHERSTNVDAVIGDGAGDELHRLNDARYNIVDGGVWRSLSQDDASY